MTEASLNANSYIDICSIPSKFHMCMYARMMNISAQNKSKAIMADSGGRA